MPFDQFFPPSHPFFINYFFLDFKAEHVLFQRGAHLQEYIFSALEKGDACNNENTFRWVGYTYYDCNNQVFWDEISVTDSFLEWCSPTSYQQWDTNGSYPSVFDLHVKFLSFCSHCLMWISSNRWCWNVTLVGEFHLFCIASVERSKAAAVLIRHADVQTRTSNSASVQKCESDHLTSWTASSRNFYWSHL